MTAVCVRREWRKHVLLQVFISLHSRVPGCVICQLLLQRTGVCSYQQSQDPQEAITTGTRLLEFLGVCFSSKIILSFSIKRKKKAKIKISWVNQPVIVIRPFHLDIL